jgi:tetratricopeptide (TPR) repeat protein
MLKFSTIVGFLLLFASIPSFSQMSKLDSGYYYLSQGSTKKAIVIFENHLKENPKDNKIHLQLGYIYYSQNKLDKSLKHFQYVGKHSTNEDDIEKSRSAAFVIKDELSLKARTALDI